MIPGGLRTGIKVKGFQAGAPVLLLREKRRETHERSAPLREAAERKEPALAAAAAAAASHGGGGDAQKPARHFLPHPYKFAWSHFTLPGVPVTPLRSARQCVVTSLAKSSRRALS